MSEKFNNLPVQERPYERCIRHGAEGLSDRELLAVLLRTGSKERTVLELAGDLLKLVPEKEGFTGLRRLNLEELTSVHGIGTVKALQVKCWNWRAGWPEKKLEKASILRHQLLLQSIIWRI